MIKLKNILEQAKLTKLQQFQQQRKYDRINRLANKKQRTRPEPTVSNNPPQNVNIRNQIPQITLVDPADRESNNYKVRNDASEYNLLDNELVNYDFDGFEFDMPRGKYTINISDGFTDDSDNKIHSFESPGGRVRIEDIVKYDKINLEILDKNNQQVFRASFIPN